MALNLGNGITQLFPHSREFSQGIGTRGIRKGAATFIVALDGSGDFDDIQEAINALGPEGGVIYIKEGTYLMNSWIEITNSNIHITGTGAGTVLYAKDSSPDFYFLYANTKENIIISDLSIDGNKNNQPGTTDLTGIYLNQCKNCRIENVFIKNLQGSAWGIRTFSTDDTKGRHVITNCLLNDNEVTDGIEISDQNCVISNNTLRRNGEYGKGITLSFFNNNVVSSNTIKNYGSSGICIHYANKNIIISNISTSNDDGIDLDSYSDRNIVLGNICLDNSGSQIANNGTNTVLAHNITT